MVEGLDASDRTLRDILLHNESIEIPLYQRRYRWKEDKIETLWEDITAALEETRGKRTLFLGPTVFHKEEISDGEMSRFLVDGQQRLTTLSLMIAYVFHKLGEVTFQTRSETQRAGATRQNLLKMLFDTGGRRPELDKVNRYQPRLELSLSYDDRRKFRQYLKKFDKVGQNTYLKKAMRTVEGLIDSEVEDRIRYDLDLDTSEDIPDEDADEMFGTHLLELADELYALFDQTASFAVVEISDPFNPLSVFESLNSKGLSLAESDLIKNILIQRVNDEHKEEVARRWDDLTEGLDTSIVPFLRYWHISEYSFIRRKHLYSSVKSLVQSQEDVDRILDRWEIAAEWYSSINQGLNPPKGDEELHSLLQKYSELGFKQGIPILLAFASAGRLNQMKDAVPILNTLYVRLFVTKSVRGSVVERKLEEICQEIRETDRGLERLRREAETLVSSHCPEINWRGLEVRDTKTQKFLLTEITKHELNDPAKELPTPTRLEVEHVLPTNRQKGTYENFDDIDKENMENHIGNLALLLGEDNTWAGNKPFNEKKKVYSEYSLEADPTPVAGDDKPIDKRIPLTARLTDYADWTTDAVRERGYALGQIADKIWTIPES